jgi:hypothetical protein
LAAKYVLLLLENTAVLVAAREARSQRSIYTIEILLCALRLCKTSGEIKIPD